MFVLSRRLGESVVIDDHLVLTAAFLTEDFVELSLIRVDGTFLGSDSAPFDKFVTLTDELRVVAIRFQDGNVRLGRTSAITLRSQGILEFSSVN